MVNLNKDTVMIFSKSNELFVSYQKLMFNLRVLIVNKFKRYGINSYAAFESYVLSISPFEDQNELLRFWNGNYPSEYIIDKMQCVSSLIEYVDISKFQSNVNYLSTIYYKSPN